MQVIPPKYIKHKHPRELGFIGKRTREETAEDTANALELFSLYLSAVQCLRGRKSSETKERPLKIRGNNL